MYYNVSIKGRQNISTPKNLKHLILFYLIYFVWINFILIIKKTSLLKEMSSDPGFFDEMQQIERKPKDDYKLLGKCEDYKILERLQNCVKMSKKTSSRN